MRVLVCGDRNWTDRVAVRRRLSELPAGTVVIQGEARGADSIARDVATGLGFHVESYPAQWEKFGRAAGPIRNQQMLEEGKPELVIAFHENLANSRGTRNMVRKAEAAGLPVEVLSG